MQSCPECGSTDIDSIEWDDDTETMECADCGCKWECNSITLEVIDIIKEGNIL